MKTKRASGIRRAASTVAIAVGLAGGCAVNVTPGNDNGAGDGSGDADGGSQIVTVTFRNLTATEAVEVEFHATEDDLETLPDDLFDPDNGYLLVRNIGVGGTGVLGPGQEDTIELACAEHLVIGTTGGTFVDNETGDIRGTGTELWLQKDGFLTCGALVVFEFSAEGEGFRTDPILIRAQPGG